MNDGPFFLDTTTFADSLFGGSGVSRAIRELLKGHPVLTSNYVREQFRATFLRAAVLAYNHLAETKDPWEVVRRTDQYQFFTRGEGAKARKVIARLMENTDAEVSDKLATLERLIEFEMMRLFERLAALRDDTKCCLCPDDPKRDPNGIYRFAKNCTLKDPRPCVIEAFWQSRQDDLNALASADPSSKENRPIEQAIKAANEVVHAGQLPRGQRCYVALSDTSIVAESEPGSTLVTSNLRDFVPLAAIIGRRSVQGYLPTQGTAIPATAD